MRWFLAVLFPVLAAAPVSAADPPFPHDLESGREAAILGTTAGLFGAGWLTNDAYRPLTPEEIAAHDPASLPAIERAATRRWSPRADLASDVLVYSLMAAPLSLMVTDRGGKEPSTLGLIYLETMLLESGTVFLLKNIFQRSRPFVYNDDPAIPMDLKMSRTARRSFPSGHAANAFASMVFTATMFEEFHPDSGARGWVWGGCLAAASTTAYLRYAAGRHFLTDLVAGAAVGGLAGWLVPRWHEVDRVDPMRDPSAGSGPGLTVAFGFGF